MGSSSSGGSSSMKTRMESLGQAVSAGGTEASDTDVCEQVPYNSQAPTRHDNLGLLSIPSTTGSRSKAQEEINHSFIS